jgi:hypothetical protein
MEEEVYTGHHGGRAGVLQKKGLLRVAALLLVLHLLGPPHAWCAQVVFPSTDVTTCSYSDASTPTYPPLPSTPSHVHLVIGITLV